jgi:transglutaminase/protease-like cytokinesis protein 3
LACVLPWSATPLLNAQVPDFQAADDHARSLPFRGDADIVHITDSLTAPFGNEMEKGRAIFVWITENIEYDCGRRNRLREEPDEALHPLYYTRQQLQLILATRRTRCDGYAFLFRLMCRLAGIYATTMEGYARFSGEKVDPATVQPNHAWNAACFDGVWYEMDVTAAAGQCADGNFLRVYGGQYFLMNESLRDRLYIPIDDSRNSINSGRIILKF